MFSADLRLLYYGYYNFTASPITRIDGEDVQTYLKKVGLQSSFHDVHARYNALFPNQAIKSLNNTYLGTFASGIYRGPNNTYTFEVNRPRCPRRQ